MMNSRQRLLDALVTITAERGLDQVSIREVAAAADVSIGTVQYYCRSKEDMLRMTWEHVAQQILSRATGVERTSSVGETVRRVLLELLPLDEPRSIESRVYLAFAARAATSTSLADVQHTLLGELRGQLAQQFQRAKDNGEAPTELVPEVAAAATAALIDGLLLHLLTDPAGLSPDTATTVLDAHLTRLLDANHAGDEARRPGN